MSNIKAGEVARLKVSGEDVFVLGITGENAEVRRPTAGQNGVYHLVETFTTAELETPEENRSRILAEQYALRKLMPQEAKFAESLQ